MMLCYRDMTFCSAKCRTTECMRNWTDEKAKAARDWWGGDDAPVAFSDFSAGCKFFKPEGASA